MKQTANHIRTATLADCIRDTAATHGVAWAAKHYAKRGINISVVRFALFGRY